MKLGGLTFIDIWWICTLP